jgi:hypothetical protein
MDERRTGRARRAGLPRARGRATTACRPSGCVAPHRGQLRWGRPRRAGAEPDRVGNGGRAGGRGPRERRASAGATRRARRHGRWGRDRVGPPRARHAASRPSGREERERGRSGKPEPRAATGASQAGGVGEPCRSRAQGHGWANRAATPRPGAGRDVRRVEVGNGGGKGRGEGSGTGSPWARAQVGGGFPGGENRWGEKKEESWGRG